MNDIYFIICSILCKIRFLNTSTTGCPYAKFHLMEHRHAQENPVHDKYSVGPVTL